MRRGFRSWLATLVVLAGVAAGCANTHDRPPLQFPPTAAPSRIVDSQGRLITTLAEENRQSVPLSQVAVVAQQAIVAIEDARFWSHSGVDPRAIGRAAKANAAADEISEGGSTITQQYVKNAYLDNERTISRKVEEATLALALERAYSKDLILEQYLNTIYFGGGAYGVEAASLAFFAVPAAQLQLHQAALLAGIVQAPGRYDPRKHPEEAKLRRDLVLDRMEGQGYITPEQQLATSALPLGVTEAPPAPEAVRYPAAHFVEEVKHWLLVESDALGDNQAQRYDNLLRGGLTITTTVDLDLQAKAEEAMRQVLPGQGSDSKMPDAALTSVEPATGFVRAMVGGYDFFGTHPYAKLNLSTGAGRQTGSAFKPIVLATALANGVPLDKRFDAPGSATFSTSAGPWNVKGGGIGTGTLAECTIVSSNTCYANIILDDAVGPQKAVEMAQRLGITHTELGAWPSAVLGSNNATVLDMASAYSTFANGGVHVPPVYVTKIERADGTVLYEHRHTQAKALEPEVARQVNDILPLVISAPNGTGNDANIGRVAGGKTGSSQNNVDGWFCGYTPQLATAVWVGFSQPRVGRDGVARPVSMTSPNTRITVFGGTYPARIWAAFMSRALEGVEALPLNPPVPPPTTTTVPPADPEILTQVTQPGLSGVPDVLEMTRDDATAALRRAGFGAEPVEIEATGEEPPGRVVAQSPAPGAESRSGTVVWLEVTAGSPASTTPVPDLRGYGAGQAREELEALGFTVEEAIVAPPAGTLRPDGEAYQGGQVWRTRPGARELAPDGKVLIEWTPQSASPSTTTTRPTD
jgi:penicillin-binding protein 1A